MYGIGRASSINGNHQTVEGRQDRASSTCGSVKYRGRILTLSVGLQGCQMGDACEVKLSQLNVLLRLIDGISIKDHIQRPGRR